VVGLLGTAPPWKRTTVAAVRRQSVARTRAVTVTAEQEEAERVLLEQKTLWWCTVVVSSL